MKHTKVCDQIMGQFSPPKHKLVTIVDSEDAEKMKKLIAAAPEMLEALQDVLNMCNDHLGRGFEFDAQEVSRNVREVIKKATS